MHVLQFIQSNCWVYKAGLREILQNKGQICYDLSQIR